MGTMSDYFRSFKEDGTKKTEGQTPSAPAVTVNEKSSSTKMSDYFRGLKKDTTVSYGDTSAFDDAISKMHTGKGVSSKGPAVDPLQYETAKIFDQSSKGLVDNGLVSLDRSLRGMLEHEAMNDKNVSNPGFVKTENPEVLPADVAFAQFKGEGKQEVKDWSGGLKFRGQTDIQMLGFTPGDMTDIERYTYSYFLERDSEKAEQYLEAIKADVNARTAERRNEPIKELNKKVPFAGAAISVIGAPVTAPLALIDQGMAMATGKEYDPNGGLSALAGATDAARDDSLSKIDSDVGRFFASAGLSAVENIWQTAVSGGLSQLARGMMSVSAASSTYREAKLLGASNEQALIVGVIAGIAEYVAEKIPTERLLKIFSGEGIEELFKGSIKRVLPALIKQGLITSGSEFVEEFTTEEVNKIADAIVMGDMSNFATAKAAYIENGDDESTATRKAFMQNYIYEPLLAGAAGAVAGGGMHAAGVAVNAPTYAAIAKQNKAARNAAKTSPTIEVPQAQDNMPTVPTNASEVVPKVPPATNNDGAESAKAFSQYAQGVFEAVDNDTYEAELMSDPEIADAVSDMDVGEGDTFTPSDGVIQARDVHEDFRNTGKFIPDTPTQEFRKAEAAKAKNDIQRSGILAGASKADIRLAEIMSALTGRNVIFESNYYRINGYFDGDNTIFVNTNRADGIFAQVLAHELTHSVEGTKAYAGIVKAVRSFVEANTFTDDNGVTHDWNYYFTEAHADQDEMYPQLTGKPFTDAKADAEVVAKVLQGFFADNAADAARTQVALDAWLAETVKTNKTGVTYMWYKLSQMAKRIRSDIKDMRARKAEGYDAAARERELMLRKIEDIRDRFGRALMEAKKAAAKSGDAALSVNKTHYDYSKSFAEQIDDYKNGIIPIGDTLIVGETPEVFKQIGFNALPLTINTTHVDYALYNTKDADHYLGETQLKQLPEKIKKPLAVIKSKTHPKTSVIALLDFTVNGKQAIIPVVIDGTGKQNGILIDSNAITSVYGKGSALNQMYDAIFEESKGNTSLFYWDKNKAIPLLHQTGHQLSGMLIPRDGFNHSIRENGSSVKPKLENVTESQQFKRWFGDWLKHPKNASKVVNADGTPKVMYHGTNEDFYIFDHTKGKKRVHLNVLGEGNYFTARKEGAEHYGERVVDAYLSIKNPYIFKSKEYTTVADQIADEYGMDRDSFKGSDVQNFLKGKNFDGVLLLDADGEVIMANAFDSTQIKSATDNIGTFDKTNPDIRFSYTPDSDYIGTKPINDAETANRKRALEMYRQLDAGKDIGNGNMDPAEYIYMQTGWAYDGLGNFIVDHEAPIYIDSSEQHRMTMRRADHAEGVNNALRSENAGLREGLERAVSVARDAYGMKSSDYTSTTKAARDIIGRITDMFGGGYTKKQANGFIKKLLSIYDKRSEVDSYGVRAVPDEQISSELGALVAEMQDIGIEDAERRELQRQLKSELKVPVYLSEKARGDFSGGYGKMAKDYRGRVNFTTKDRGVPVDVRYEELTGIFPDMFPADITSEADQAAKILEISDMIRDEEFATESRYMFSGGEAQSRADAVDAARVIFEGFRQMDAMPKTEADRYAREAEKARRAADEVRKNSAEQIARETERIRDEERRRADEETEWIKFYEDRDNARMAAEYREGLQRAEERVDQVAENYRQATDEMANEYREALDKQAEDAAKAYQKERIKRTFNRIKKLYDNPTKNHNIKESERDFVKSALDLMESIFASGVTPRTMVNLDYSYATETEQKNLDHLRGLYDRLSDLEAKTKDQKVIAPETSAVMDDLKEEIHRYETRLSELFTRKRNELQGMTVTRLMSDFAAEYGKLRDAEEGYISDAYDPAVHERLSNMASNRELSGKTVRKLTSSELESIYEVFASAVNVVYRTNNMFNDRKGATLMENVTDTITELNDVNASRPTGKINRFIDKHFKWANFKPVYAMRYLGSKTMSRLYDNLRKGEDVYAKDIDEARTFYKGEVEKYNADDWNLKEKHTFSTESGQRFELTLDQMMSVYAYSKRDQAALHFSDGGIIPKSKTDKIWGKSKHKAEKASPGNIDAVINSIVGDATAYKLTGKALDTVIDSLTAEQKKFVDDLQNYMSNELSAKGNEVSRAMYGIDLFKEKFYMPLKSATQYMKVRYEEGKGDVRIKNKGMTKETVSGANNPVVVEGFTDVWANHVNEMSLYHAMVLPMEDFSKVFGYAGGITEQRADANVRHDNISVRAVIENLYGENATKYIDKLIRDINGGIKADTEGALDAMISKSKKASVLASLSVIIQQPTAGIRAMAYIDPKYFVGKKAGKSAEKSWEECKKYAPVAVIKEMGRFDTGTGVNTAKYITDNKSVLELADDLAGWGASKADEVTWSSIWEACKREAADKNKALKTNDAICRAAAQRFTEVVSLTQVYDSVFSRSETMRSKNQLHQMATSFMSEPVTVANMVYDAFVQAKRGDKQILGRVVSAVVVSTLVNNALKSIIYAMRDDDEDETYLEKYLGSLVSNTLDSMNPLTYLPYVRDVWSLFQGYDVERMDVALIQNLVDAIVYAAGPKGSTLEKIERVAGVAGDMFGIPAKNLLRELRGIYNGVTTLAADISGKTPTTLHGVTNAVTDSLLDPVYRMPYVGNLIDKESKTDKLYDAILKDKSHAERMRGTYKDDVAYESALKTALKENDPRVQQAADARYAGDIDVYDDIVNEIVADGKFDKRIVVGAVNSAYNAMNKTDTARTPDEKAVSIYTSEMVGEAFKLGDEETALKAVEDLIGVKMENGADEKKARSSVKTSVTKVMKPLYLEAYESGDSEEMSRVKQFLEDTGLYGDSAKSSLDGWEKEYNSEHGKPETQTKSSGSQYKFNIPEVKVPEVKVPKVEVPKFNFNFK